MVLTVRQRNALKNAPPKTRSSLLRNFNSQTAKVRTQKLPQRRPTQPPRQVVAKVPRPLRMERHPLNAFNNIHLPLPERTAPYIVTSLVESLEISTASYGQVVIVAQRSGYDPEFNLGPVTDYIAIAYNAADTVDKADSSLLTPLKVARHKLADGLPRVTASTYLSLKHRLHNLSAHVECLGTTGAGMPPGDTFIGRVTMAETGSTSSAFRNNESYYDAFVDKARTVGNLRSVTNAALQRQPVTIHAVVAEPVRYNEWSDLYIPSTSTSINSLDMWPGLTPLIWYIPPQIGTSVVSFRMNIAMQFCSRHPDVLVARANHRQFEPSTHTAWNAAVSSVEDVGEAVGVYNVGRAFVSAVL